MKHISLCILSYNRSAFLKDSIRTATENADEPIEIIVHDDGSTEPGLREYLHHLVGNGRISRLISNPPGHNEGQGIALNRMFYMAKGDIIVKADHDLTYRPGWTRAIRETIDGNRERMKPKHGVKGIDFEGEPKIGALGLFKYYVEPVNFPDTHIADWSAVQHPDGSTSLPQFHDVTDFVGSLMAIPREALVRFGPFEERSPAFAEDAVFKQKLAAARGWCNALTTEDFVDNHGFGVGPSTLVEGFDDNNEGIIHKIKPGPKLIG